MRRLILVAAAMFIVTPTAAETYTVTMAGMNYVPASLTARVGSTIRFVNDDDINHAVFVPTASYAINLGVQKPGEAREMTLTQQGIFEVECAIHDHMLLSMKVLP